MTTRKRGAGRPLAVVVAQLPEEFLRIDVSFPDGSMRELGAYMGRLGAYLSQELGREVDNCEVVDVMESLGIPPAKWYEAAFAADASRFRPPPGAEPDSPE